MKIKVYRINGFRFVVRRNKRKWEARLNGYPEFFPSLTEFRKAAHSVRVEDIDIV